MNILPDSLKLSYEPEPVLPAVTENPIKELISETGAVAVMIEDVEIDPTIPLDTDDNADMESKINKLEMPAFVPKPSPNISMFEDKKPIKLTRKGKPRKPMSEEHKAKLAVARVKANAKKAYLKEQRDKAKEEAKALKSSKSVVAPIPAIKEVAEPTPQPTPEPTHQPTPEPIQVKEPSVRYVGITKEDLEKSQLNTILTIEKMRKDRKSEKKKKQLEEEYKQDTIKTIKKINNWRETAGVYQNCF